MFFFSFFIPHVFNHDRLFLSFFLILIAFCLFLHSASLKVTEITFVVQITLCNFLRELALPLTCRFGIREFLAVRVQRETHGLNGLVVQVKAEADALVECNLGLVRRVDIDDLLALHEAAVVVEGRINNTVADRLGHDELGVLLAVETESDANVTQGDLGVRQADHADTRLDDVVAQTQDECVRLVLFEYRIELGEGFLELVQITNADSYPLKFVAKFVCVSKKKKKKLHPACFTSYLG